jgi:hypothetical protein
MYSSPTQIIDKGLDEGESCGGRVEAQWRRRHGPGPARPPPPPGGRAGR